MGVEDCQSTEAGGEAKVKVQALLDAELVLELHVFAAVFQPMAVLRNGWGKREPFPLWLDRPSL